MLAYLKIKITCSLKYEKIAIGIIIAIFLLFLILPDFLIILFVPIFFIPVVLKSLIWCSSGHSIHTMGIPILGGDFEPMYVIAALLGPILFIILYYRITNKIFQEPHKKRKILIGFIILYLIIGFFSIFMGIGPH